MTMWAVVAALSIAAAQSAADQSFEGRVLHGVPHLYDANGVLKPGLQPLRFLTPRPESGGVGDAMGKLVPVFELALEAINNGSSVLPGYVVELYLTDSKCVPHTGVQVTIRLLNKFPKGFFKAVFGPLCSDTAGAVNDALQAYNLFQVASISRSPAQSDRARHPYLCRLSPALSFVTEAIVQVMQLFGWTRVGLLRDDRALSDSAILSVQMWLKRARDAFDAGNASGYAFDLDYSGLHSYIFDGATDEAAVVAAIKQARVRVLVGALYEDAGLRFFCELYKQGYFGKRMQFILATGPWSDTWITEQLGEQTGTALGQSGGGCTMEQVFAAARYMACISQVTRHKSLLDVRHSIIHKTLRELKNAYYRRCMAEEGCHNEFAATEFDGLSTLANSFDVWLRGGGNLSAIDYESTAPVQELYNITVHTDFRGLTGIVRFDLSCGRKGTFTLQQYSALFTDYRTGRAYQGWADMTSYNNADGFASLLPWHSFLWQDGTETYFGNGTGWADVAPGVVASFGHGATGLENVLSDWKACPPGTTVDESGRDCVDCPRGRHGQGTECTDCPHGTYASREGMELCPNCPSGKYQNETGASGCADCQAGYISNAEAPWQCRACPRGQISSRAGLDLCDACAPGRYQDSEGASACVSCAEALGDPALWTTGPGATRPEECVCSRDYFRTPLLYDGSADGSCRACPEGTECPEAGSSEEALLAQVGAGPGGEIGIRGVLLKRYPSVLAGFMTRSSEPLRVYRCQDARHCPGGPPGACAAHHDSEEIGCARCVEGAYISSEGLCEPCHGANVTLLIVAAVLGGIVALTIAAFVVNMGTLQQQSSVMAAVIVAGIIFTGVQTLGLYYNLNVIFFEPLRTVLSFMQLLTLDLKMLKMECTFPFSPISQYLVRQFIPPSCAAITAVICLFKKVFAKRRILFRVEYMNAVGTLFSIFFLSIVVSSMAPLNCYAHPGDSGSSMLTSPSILCFGGDARHSHMVSIGLLSFSLIIVPFMALAGWATRMYPRWTASIGARNSARLWMFRWLFFRFHPERYYYGVVFLTRNLLICMVPIFPGCRDDQALQVILICAFLLVFMCIQTLLRPWRAHVTNVVDGVLTSLLVLILACGALATDFQASSASIARVGAVVFSLWSGAGVLMLGLLVYGRVMARGKPYGFFICHHKAGAGTFARLVKSSLTRHPRVRKKVFIDSDDLKDLDKLFEIVAAETDTLVVLCSREILLRPWCIGEIVTARARGVKTVRVIFREFFLPDETWIDNYDSKVKDLSCLTSRGITLSAVKDALHWLNDKGMIMMPESISSCTLYSFIDELVSTGSGTVAFMEDVSPEFGKTAVIVDHTNTEAEATGLLLAQMSLVHFVEDPEQIPYVLPRGEPVPESVLNVLIVCTMGALDNPDFLLAIMQAGQRQLNFIPILADERFRFPLGDALQDCRITASRVSSKPEKVLRLITEIFSAIAVSFYSNQSSEDVLKTSVLEVAERLKANCKAFRRRSKFSQRCISATVSL